MIVSKQLTVKMGNTISWQFYDIQVKSDILCYTWLVTSRNRDFCCREFLHKALQHAYWANIHTYINLADFYCAFDVKYPSASMFWSSATFSTSYYMFKYNFEWKEWSISTFGISRKAYTRAKRLYWAGRQFFVLVREKNGR